MSMFKSAARRVLNGEMERLEETVDVLGRELLERGWTVEQLQESVRMLELALRTEDWRLLSVEAQQEFTVEGMRQIREMARLMHLKNPVIKRGVDLQALYVWALGVSISGRDARINQVVQEFLEDERNEATLTTHQARMKREKELQLDANLFFRFFVNQQTGRVRVRTVSVDDVVDIVMNPEDREEPWFYGCRVWGREAAVPAAGKQAGVAGADTAGERLEWYPDWRFTPRSKRGYAEKLAKRGHGKGTINWDTPVYHVAVNQRGRWGISEVYAALDWSLAFKRFLEDLATVWRALARWSAKLTTKGGKRGVAAAKSKLATTLATGVEETNPPPVTGSVFIGGEGTALEPFRTAGATMSAEDGRRLFLMAIASLGFPETFYGDVSVGTLATAKSLDRPTELRVHNRQALWTGVHLNVLGFVLKWAVRAPQGALRAYGRVLAEKDGDQWLERLVWNRDVDATIDMIFPPVVERDLAEYVGAAVQAAGLPAPADGERSWLRTFVRLLLTAFEVEAVDELVEQMFDEDEAPAMNAAGEEQEDTAETAGPSTGSTSTGSVTGTGADAAEGPGRAGEEEAGPAAGEEAA